VIGPVLDRETWRFVVRMTLACAVVAAVMLGSIVLLDHLGLDADSSGQALGVFASSVLLGIASYVGATRLLRLEELPYVVRSVLRR
jgi:putative peptidoglycan lipid II flippase